MNKFPPTQGTFCKELLKKTKLLKAPGSERDGVCGAVSRGLN